MSNNPFGNGPRTIDPDIEKIKKIARRIVPVAAVLIVLIVLAANSVYTINSGEEAVLTQWGRYTATQASPGLHVKIPFVENYQIVNVEGVRRLEFGIRSTAGGQFVDVPEEALMLTGNETLVTADWVVQYRIDNSYNYLFKVDDPESTLRVIAESAYRRVTASHDLDDILTNQKDAMQLEIREDLQAICNKYDLGVRITAVQLQDAAPPDEVKASFLDVTSAIEDKNAKINEATRYANERLPLARGDAAALLNEANGYKQKRINEALGAVARYTAIETEYRAQPAIMRTRLYLEMIREVLPGVDRVYFVDPNKGNILQFLPLDGSSNLLTP